uniref:Uncharacterized protein n=1 Tax=Anopheles atroparvus TaxID=41427 RepID=A0AAG5CPV7_ANOAO
MPRHSSLKYQPETVTSESTSGRKMPIFQKKFALKIAPPRTQRLNIGCPPPQEDLDDFRSITLNLVDKQLCFVDGVWMNAHSMDDLLRMKRRVKTLEQENNMLQVKLDVLVDLLTENVIDTKFPK